MLDITQRIRANIHVIKRLLPILSFIPPILILYSLHPESFQTTYHGRILQLFFLWLIILETILTWEETRTTLTSTLKSTRTIPLIVSLLLPTVYVVASSYYGLSTIIAEAAEHINVPFAYRLPLSIEYVVFAIFLALAILLMYGKKRLVDFSIPTFFLLSIGAIFAIDNLYPYGWFTPFQILVPATAILAANILTLMGYQTYLSLTTHSEYGFMPQLSVSNPLNTSGQISFGIAWPCAGVESLIIYSVTILLFLKKTLIPWRRRILYFVIGACITYLINILRIVAIFVISMGGGDVGAFHDFYGGLYSIVWIVSYPLILIGSRIAWGQIKNWTL